MKPHPGLDERWIKASILATLWAASEIVLGSFLHNLRIPFSGNILTGIGLLILISVSHVWTEKGLIWRAGFLTAIMKTLSPSAVIFGPMIAIMAEAVLLECAVRLFGRSIAGYLVGGVLAMSWNLLHKIANFILFYGFNIVTLYENLIRIAQKQFSVQSDITWLPVLLLLVVHAVLGAAAAVVGMRMGRALQKQERASGIGGNRYAHLPTAQNNLIAIRYSLAWLLMDVLLLLAALFLLYRYDWTIWVPSIIVLVMVWAFRYRRAWRQLAKPKFWIYFVLITMLTAWLFSYNAGPMQALLIGLQMNFRAAVIVLGLAVLGTELYHPKIRAFFKKGAFKQLAAALDLSLAGLPSVIADLPDAKTLLKNPVLVLYNLISSIENRLAEIKKSNRGQVFIITGAIGQGKTACVQQILKMAAAANIPVAGIYSPRIVEQGETVGYDVVDIESGSREPFLRSTGDEAYEKIGRFQIFPQGLHLGRCALADARAARNHLVIVDEVGKLELDDKGWLPELVPLLESGNTMVMTVRDVFAEMVIRNLKIAPTAVYNQSDNSNENIADMIVKGIAVNEV